MDFLELVKKRVSVRAYDSPQIKREQIEKCLAAAQLSPSACNSQPWQFVIVDKPQPKDKLTQAMLSGIYGKTKINEFIKEAAVLVVVVSDKEAWLAKVCNYVRDTKMYLIDIGIACEHFVLQAEELGIGTCYIGWFNEKAVKKLLGIPRTKRVHVIITMGYPKSGFRPKERKRKSLSEMRLYKD